MNNKPLAIPTPECAAETVRNILDTPPKAAGLHSSKTSKFAFATKELTSQVLSNLKPGLSFKATPTLSPIELGNAIKARRRELKLTQQALSEKSGLGIRFISEIENGKATAELGKVLELLAALDLQLRVTGRG